MAGNIRVAEILFVKKVRINDFLFEGLPGTTIVTSRCLARKLGFARCGQYPGLVKSYHEIKTIERPAQLQLRFFSAW